MDPSYGQLYRDLYRRHWWWRVRETAILYELERIQPSSGWSRILDVGCGDGLFFDELARFGQVEGIEPDVELLDAMGRWRHAIHAIPFDANFRPSHRFDLILMLDVLEHLHDPAGALRNALALLQPSGTVLITVPAFQWLWTHHDDINHHVRRYDRRSFGALATETGFAIHRQRYLFQWLVAAKLGARAVERFRKGHPRLPTIPARPLNASIRGFTALEERVGRTLPFPAGSSLLVIGGANPPVR